LSLSLSLILHFCFFRLQSFTVIITRTLFGIICFSCSLLFYSALFFPHFFSISVSVFAFFVQLSMRIQISYLCNAQEIYFLLLFCLFWLSSCLIFLLHIFLSFLSLS